MNVKTFAMANPLLILAAGVGLYVVVRGPSQVGKDIGNLLGNLAGGAVDGAASGAGNVVGSVIAAPMLIASAAADKVTTTALDPSKNPLYDLGTSIGGGVYTFLHPSTWAK